MDEPGAGEIVELVLPSGRKITAKRPQPHELFAWGALLYRREVFSQPLGQPFTDRQLDDLAGVIFELLSYCCVKPRISLLPRDTDEIRPADMLPEDYMWVVRWALGQEATPAPAKLPCNRVSGKCRRKRGR